jgi:phosphoribosylformimino-5-aminoimidazole carboxamide ribotide isomerase
MSFTLYPAIDLREGRVVRLDQGDFARETRYGDDPVALARAYAAAGARWLHVVDLDAARSGRFTQFEVIARLARIEGLAVQAGGGVRSIEHVQALFDAGVARVVVGSMAVTQAPKVAGWLAQFGAERMCIALDTRATTAGDFELPVSGWTDGSGVPLSRMLDFYAVQHAARHLLCTDIQRDGMLGGPNVDLYAAICRDYPALAVQASGGVRDAADVRAARAAGAAGAIVGKALLEGRVGIEELLAC